MIVGTTRDADDNRRRLEQIMTEVGLCRSLQDREIKTCAIRGVIWGGRRPQGNEKKEKRKKKKEKKSKKEKKKRKKEGNYE